MEAAAVRASHATAPVWTHSKKMCGFVTVTAFLKVNRVTVSALSFSLYSTDSVTSLTIMTVGSAKISRYPNISLVTAFAFGTPHLNVKAFVFFINSHAMELVSMRVT